MKATIALLVLLFFFGLSVFLLTLVSKKDKEFTEPNGKFATEDVAKISQFAQFIERAKIAISQTMEKFAEGKEVAFSNSSSDYWEEKALRDGLAQVYKDVNKKWGRFIRSQSKQYGVDPKQVIAIICKESAGNQDTFNLESKTGAWGLMAIILSTAQAYQPGITSEDLLDPELNIHIGIQRLADAKKIMKTDPGAIFAYHWGETGGRRLLASNAKSAEESDDWQFIQAIIKVAEQG